MKVQQYMHSPAITIAADTTVPDALTLMRTYSIRRLPIVDKNDRLIGIVTDRDLLHASASSATTLSIWELNYLLAKLTVQKVMTKNVLMARPDQTLEDVARLLLKYKIGGLPVVNENKEVIGVITQTDIFRAFLDRETQSATEPSIFA